MFSAARVHFYRLTPRRKVITHFIASPWQRSKLHGNPGLSLSPRFPTRNWLTQRCICRVSNVARTEDKLPCFYSVNLRINTVHDRARLHSVCRKEDFTETISQRVRRAIGIESSTALENPGVSQWKEKPCQSVVRTLAGALRGVPPPPPDFRCLKARRQSPAAYATRMELGRS